MKFLVHPGGRGGGRGVGLPVPPAQPAPPPLLSPGLAQPWLTCDGPDGGVCSVSHTAGELLVGPLAQDGHLAGDRVEAGARVLDSREGQGATIQGSCVPGHGHWLWEVAPDQAAQRLGGGAGFATRSQGVDQWALDGGCGDRARVSTGLRTVTHHARLTADLGGLGGRPVGGGWSSAGDAGTFAVGAGSRRLALALSLPPGRPGVPSSELLCPHQKQSPSLPLVRTPALGPEWLGMGLLSGGANPHPEVEGPPRNHQASPLPPPHGPHWGSGTPKPQEPSRCPFLCHPQTS